MATGEVSQILGGLLPLLRDLKTSLEETAAALPRVSSQLSSVNRATESATVEILNTLDRIDQRLSQTGETLGALRSAWDRRNEPQTSIHDTLTAIEQAVQETRQDSISIAMALQVQDITSQQIAGVSHLMDSVRARLEELFRESETPPAAQGPAPVPPTFDGNAAYTTSGERQNQADDIVQQWHKGAS